MKKIYLASPYSHKDPSILAKRFDNVNRAAAVIMQMGHAVFSPISHSHPIADHIGNHLSHDFWLKQDLAFFDWADELWILCLDGWEISKGVRIEMMEWKRTCKPVCFVVPENRSYKIYSLQEVFK